MSNVTSSCECSPVNDPRSACPIETRCQTSPILMCIDCECGLCGKDNDSCCQSNGSNECALIGNSECILDNSFFAAVAGTGSSCANSINVGVTGMPPECGCNPDRAAPCTYDGSQKQPDLSCFLCNANDLAAGQCPACNLCLSNANSCINSSLTAAQYQSCLALISAVDRKGCNGSCTKW